MSPLDDAARSAAIGALLRPRSAVVIGASAKRRGSGNFALANLVNAGHEVDVHLVHPTAEAIDGRPTTPSVNDLPTGIDMALVSLPSRSLMPVLHALAERGCRAAVVPTSGLDAGQQRELAHFVEHSRMAVHGPNCMGLINVTDGVAGWFYDDTLTDQRKGPISLVSQSGSAAFLTRAVEGIGFSKIVSTGNEIALTTADYVRWLADDPDTTTVGLVLESLSDVPGFVASIRTLRDAGKRAVALKVGRTERGLAAARAHTGALAGGHAGYAALFEELDVPLVSDYDELATALQVMAAPAMPSARGARVGIVTDSGGESGLAADLSTVHNVELASFSDDTLVRLRDALSDSEIGNPLDAGASPDADDDAYSTVYSTVVNDPGVDSLMVILEGHQSLSHGELHYSDELAAALRSTALAQPGKPVIAVSSSSIATNDELREWLAPVPLVRGIGNAFAALRALAGNQRPVPGAPARPADLPDAARVRHLRERLATEVGTVGAAVTWEVLQAYGIATVSSFVAPGVDEAAAWASGRYPVAVKIVSPDVAHRSDVGGVVLDVASEQDLRDAAAAVRASVERVVPGCVIEGLEVQPMVPAGVEALVGFAADPVFGAILTAGTGGTLVELEGDVHSCPVPVDPDRCQQLLHGTRLDQRLAGYRNLIPITPTTALADLMSRISWLAADLGDLIAGCDLNPVIVEPGTGRVTAVDALLVTTATGLPSSASVADVEEVPGR